MLQSVGDGHTSTLGVMMNLASLLVQSGDIGTARAIYLRAYQIAVCVYGEAHPLSLLIVDGIGALLHMTLMEFGQAAKVFEVSLKLRAGVFDECHPHVLDALESLATCYKALKRFDESSEMYNT